MKDATEDSKELAETLASAHEKIFADDPNTEILQHCMIFTADEGSVLIQCPWGSKSERSVMLSNLASVIKESRADRYAFWSEVWMNRVELSDRAKAVEPRKDPNRQELVMTLVCERGHKPVIIMQAIERGESGGVTKLVREPADNDFTSLGGELTELFDG